MRAAGIIAFVIMGVVATDGGLLLRYSLITLIAFLLLTAIALLRPVRKATSDDRLVLRFGCLLSWLFSTIGIIIGLALERIW